MLKLVLVLLIGLSTVPKTTPCVSEWNQCGGVSYTGETTCCGSLTCTVLNPYYFQCLQGATTTVATTTTTANQANNNCNAMYGQCGGQDWTGPRCCINSVCVVSGPYYSQCLADPQTTTGQSTTTVSTTQSTTTVSTTQSTTTVTTTQSTTTVTTTQSTTVTTTQSTTVSTTQSTTTLAPTTTSASTTANQNCVAKYQQCGGIGYSGSNTCCDGFICNFLNNWYYQCLPSGNPATNPPSTTGSSASSSTQSNNNNNDPSGTTTRYWDCCKASCGWPGKASVTNPVKSCTSNGVDMIDYNAASICNNGESSMCNNQQPWSVNDTFSYGYAAAHIGGQTESDWCCACYLLTFTSTAVNGKKMMVQVTNTGGDLGDNHFDLQMPGGGFGIFNGCSKQFSTADPGPWGDRYGGVTSVDACNSLPDVLKPGCYWRFQWFQNADNPTMTFKKVDCDAALVARTQCQRT